MQNSILIFCDGACSGNPGPGGWGAIVALPSGRVRELGGANPATTNNQMEMVAAIEALRSVIELPGPVLIYTDSVYVIQGITKWIWNWKLKGWMTSTGTAVINRNLWEDLLALVTARGKAGAVRWLFVKGHGGTPGNERVDAIAVAFSKGRPERLYDGEREAYPVSLEVEPAVAKPKAKAKTAIYLSLVDGKVQRHPTWADCEKRVKGQSNAKYKKVTSMTEEKALLSIWGNPPLE